VLGEGLRVARNLGRRTGRGATLCSEPDQLGIRAKSVLAVMTDSGWRWRDATPLKVVNMNIRPRIAAIFSPDRRISAASASLG
jgi:hypothetical protein